MRWLALVFVIFLISVVYMTLITPAKVIEPKTVKADRLIKSHVNELIEPEIALNEHNNFELKKVEESTDEKIMRIHVLSDELQSLKGNALLNKMTNFWVECKSTHTCDGQLIELEKQLPYSLFKLLSDFESLRDEWLLASLSIPIEIPFNEKVNQVRQQYETVWGEYTDLLFEEEFKYYRFRSESRILQQVPPSEYIEQLNRIFEQQAATNLDMFFQSKSATFDYALRNIPNTYSEEERALLVRELSLLYLNEQETTDFYRRDLQIKNQRKEVETYQKQLFELKKSLESMRNNEYRTLSDNEWQRVYQDRIGEFKKRFFDYQ
ncbi:hypothetical protein C9J41_01725 [Photobacterium sp. GB-50]|nr:hypothetical protein C9J41_01725 [Photobacterium sp. GB-50]